MRQAHEGSGSACVPRMLLCMLMCSKQAVQAVWGGLHARRVQVCGARGAARPYCGAPTTVLVLEQLGAVSLLMQHLHPECQKP